MYFFNGNRIINFRITRLSVSREYFTTLSCTTLIASISQRSLWFCALFSFSAKSAAKVLLFFGLTKFLSNFFAIFFHFLCKWLIFSVTISDEFRTVFLLTRIEREIGCKGTAFFWTDQIFKQEKCYKTSLST